MRTESRDTAVWDLSPGLAYGGGVSSPGAGAARLLRGAWLSVLTVAISAIAHGLGGGHLPPVEMLAGLAALLPPACVWVAGRQVRPLAAGAVIAIGQVLLHGAYSVLMSCPTPGKSPTELSIAGHAGHGATEMAVHCGAATGAAGRLVLGGASMLVFHAVAIAATAAAVGGAERLVWWVRDELAARLTPPHPALVVVRRERALAAWRVDGPVPALHLRARPTRRGPPWGRLALGASPS